MDLDEQKSEDKLLSVVAVSADMTRATKPFVQQRKIYSIFRYTPNQDISE